MFPFFSALWRKLHSEGETNDPGQETATKLWLTLLSMFFGGCAFLLTQFWMPDEVAQRGRLVVGVIVLTVVFALVCFKRFRPTSLAVAVITVMLVSILGSIVTAGGLRAPGVYGLFVTVSVSGLLLGLRAAVLSGVISTAAAGVLTLAQTQGWLPPTQIHHTPLSTYTVFVLCVWFQVSAQAVVAWVSKRSEERIHASQHERDLANQELVSSRERFASIFNSLNEAVFVREAATGNLIEINRRACDMFGYTREEFFSQKLGALGSGAPGYTRADGEVWLRKTLEEGAQVFDWQARHKNGTFFWVEVNMRREFVGKEDHVLITLRDITERKLLEERLRQTQKLEVFGQIAGGVAHDFNNVLVVILNNSQLLIENAGRDPAAQVYLTEILDAGKRAAALTQQLLLFSRNEKPRLAHCDLNHVIEDVSRMLRRVIGENYDLRIQYATQGLPVLVDKIMLEQVLMNLVVNARDAMPSGGVITIFTQTYAVGSSTGSWSGYPTGNYAVFRVRDFGTGIAPDVMNRLYEPFFTTKPAGKGTGLGLAVVLGIVKQHQGRISIQTELGKGSEFIVSLPFADAPLTSTNDVSAAALPVKRKKPGNVLLVEDNEMVSKVAHRALEMQGFNVHKTPTAVEALAFLENTRTSMDLIISDVVMPGGMSGVELVDIVQARWPSTKLILMSGYNEELHRSEIPFLPKPFSAKQLLDLVDKVMPEDEPLK